MPQPTRVVNGFTAKQLAFISAYVTLKHKRLAAIEAGFSEHSASSMASQLLKVPQIKAEIDRRLAAQMDRYAVTNESIIREMAKIAYSNVDDYVAKQDDGSVIIDFSNTTRDEMAALTSIEVEERFLGETSDSKSLSRKIKFRLGEKRQALMDLAKIRAMLPADRVQVTGAGGGPVEIEATHKVDIAKLDADQREQLRTLLLTMRKRGNGQVTEVEPEED